MRRGDSGDDEARRRQLALGWSGRIVVFAVLAALAVVAVPAAAVSGVFSSSPAPGPTSPGTVDVDKPCVDKRTPTLDTTSSPPPAELTAVLAVLRRPQQPSDQLPNVDRLAMLPITGVNPDAIRLATSLTGTRIYLVPAENVRYFRPLPDTEACKQSRQPSPKPAAGVCLLERATEGAATCSDIGSIKRGLAMLTGGGRRHGFTRVAGIAHDGVSAVIWRVHRGKGFLDTRIPVRNNVYAASVPGRAGHGLYVYFVTAKGRELVRGPHRMTRRERALRRRDLARDKAAGPKPTVFPASGKPKTIFTFRMRLARPANKIYVATWDAPAGTSCPSTPGHSIGMLPALRGPQRGFIKAAFGPPIDTGRWCPGSYSGTVRVQRRG